MIVKRYTVACDGCKRAVPGIIGGAGITPWFVTSGGARAHARWSKWKRIPRRDPRDTSRGQRGMDLCPQCAPAVTG